MFLLKFLGRLVSENFLLRKEMNDTEISLSVIALDLHFFFFYLFFFLSRPQTTMNGHL